MIQLGSFKGIVRFTQIKRLYTSTRIHQEWKHALSPYYNTGKKLHEKKKKMSWDDSYFKKNKGTSMPTELRQKLGIYGQIPSVVESLEIQSKRALKLLREKISPFEKYLFMAQLRNNNTQLFYKLVNQHIEVNLVYIFLKKITHVIIRNLHRLFIHLQ